MSLTSPLICKTCGHPSSNPKKPCKICGGHEWMEKMDIHDSLLKKCINKACEIRKVTPPELETQILTIERN